MEGSSFGVSRAVHLRAWGATILLGMVVALAAFCLDGRQPWRGWAPSPELHRPGYGERIDRDRTIRTRANTFSNLAYVLVGAYACAMAVEERRRGAPTARHLPLDILFGLSMVWLGLTSGLFHASLTRLGQRLDVAAMYPPLLSLLALAAVRRLPRLVGGLPVWSLLVAVVLAAEVLFYVYKWSMPARTVLTSLIVAVAVVAVGENLLHPGRFQAGWLVAGLCLLVAGVTCRELDVQRRFTGPDAWLQGHALWHLLTAAALETIWLHERSGRSELSGRSGSEAAVRDGVAG